jgi:hypothetical protein
VDSLTWTCDSYGNPISENGRDTQVTNATWTACNEICQVRGARIRDILKVN